MYRKDKNENVDACYDVNPYYVSQAIIMNLKYSTSFRQNATEIFVAMSCNENQIEDETKNEIIIVIIGIKYVVCDKDMID